ncbi:MAG: hypothetical protein ACRDSH_16370 [Pseudonocardiaceae bacterium]
MTSSGLPAQRGAQTPRVSCWPDYVTSAGKEALDLARSVGLWLDPWQAFVLDHALGERADGKWSAFEVALIVSRQNGKGAVLEARELAGLFLFGEQLILHSAHEFKTAQEAFRRVLGWIEGRDHLRKRVKRVRTSHGEEGIELTNGARLRFVARSTGSGRGFSGDCVILDEAYNLGGDAMAALLPTLSARRNPQLIYASSAGMETSEQLLKVHERGVRGDSPRLAYFEWSADPALALDDGEAWRQANPALGIRITEEFVEGELAALAVQDDDGVWVGPEFSRERLGRWPTSNVEHVIDPEVWAKLADAESAPGTSIVFAADSNPERSRATIAAAGKRDDGSYHVEVIDRRSGTAWVPARLAELKQRWEPAAVMMDPAGPAGSWLAELAELDINPVLVNGREMAQACGSLYEAVTQRGDVRHRDQEPLNAALHSAVRRPLGDSWAWDRRKSDDDISPLVAVTLALHGFVLYGGEADALDNIW